MFTPLPNETVSRSAPEPVGPVGSDRRSAIDAALADAARRRGAEASALTLLSAEAVTWRDGSLGCPDRGALYTMALVPGFRVRVRVGDSVLDYHAGNGQMIVCPAGRAVDPSQSQAR